MRFDAEEQEEQTLIHYCLDVYLFLSSARDPPGSPDPELSQSMNVCETQGSE